MTLALGHFDAKLFKCCACNQFPDEPKILDCKHTFCDRCLGKHVTTEGTDKVCECPTCQFKTKLKFKDGVATLEENELLKIAREMCELSKEKFICTLCDEDEAQEALYVCTDCHGNLCQHCLKYHRKLKVCHEQNLFIIDEFKNEQFMPQEDHCMSEICTVHEYCKMNVAGNICKRPLCLVCKVHKKYPSKGRNTGEELGNSVQKLTDQMVKLIATGGDNMNQAQHLVNQFGNILEKLKTNFDSMQQAIQDHFHKTSEYMTRSFKVLEEQHSTEMTKEITKVEKCIVMLTNYMGNCSHALYKAVIAQTKMPATEFAQAFSSVKAQLEASFPHVHTDKPREFSYATPNDEELASVISSIAGVVKVKDSSVSADHRSDQGSRSSIYAHKFFMTPEGNRYVYSVVYCEYRDSHFFACGKDGLFEEQAGGTKKVDGRWSEGLSISACGKKLYRGSDRGAVHVFGLSKKDQLQQRPIQIITLSYPKSYFQTVDVSESVSVSAGGRVAVVLHYYQGYSLFVLTQDGLQDIVMTDVSGGSSPRSVQWVDEQSLCVRVDNGVMLISLDPVRTVWTTELTEARIVSSAGGSIFVSGRDNNKLTVLDENSGAVAGEVMCPGFAVGVCTLEDGTMATVSYS